MEKVNNVIGAPVNLATLTPQPKDALQPPESSRSTISGRSWITDDKWSDDDDDDDDDIETNAAAAASFMPKAPTKVAPPVAALGSHLAAGSTSQAIIQQVVC